MIKAKIKIGKKTKLTLNEFIEKIKKKNNPAAIIKSLSHSS
jgi:hypothetical protein